MLVRSSFFGGDLGLFPTLVGNWLGESEALYSTFPGASMAGFTGHMSR